ncbi:MAG TPA: undecaprenyldiphospho-muramoylpentapeptide beta-N-acetylglucosaminyltransferase [Thermomicrobiales bacterium]|nr:undecaprenyldiphospho-muramoylpentapeptide beta-N-acetylglucosaminyltransferase [Thermomicrobiales bacterium]
MIDADRPKERPLRLVIAGGGTGGHVLPAVAVVEELRRRMVPLELLWIGGHTGVERELAEANDIAFVAIQTGKLRRYLAIQTATDMLRIPLGIAQAFQALRAFRPDVIFGTGGNISFPTVFAGSRMAPIITHEQTAQIGVANRMASRFADVFAVPFDETAVLARQRHNRVVVTGNPVRSSILGGSREAGLRRFGFSPDFPVLYVTGGARGASPLNERVEALLPGLLEHAQILHQAGPPSANPDVERLQKLRTSWPDALQHRYHVTEFIRDEIADVYAMASLVLGRAGAGTITELARVGKPSVLIPLPGTWGDEQTKNARMLSNAGAAEVIAQKDAAPTRLGEVITSLLADPDRLARMGEAATTVGNPQAASRLVDQILALAESS